MIAVVDARQAAALDRSTISAGVPSRALMQRAGAAAAGIIATRYATQLPRGVVVCAGPGNNGGDGWVVARALAATGVSVTVVEPVAARTPDCVAERALAAPLVDRIVPALDATAGAGVVVDALLGTGSAGAVRAPFDATVASIAALRSRAAVVVALDLPSGLDATTGAADGAVAADLTVTFGAMKRGLLLDRARAGAIVVVDIGFVPADAELELVTQRWVRHHTPAIGAAAHKGTRGRVAIVGGAEGMAGAAILAIRGALRSGAGLVRAVVHDASVAAIQRSEPAAIAAGWSSADIDELTGWADAIVVGPGLGGSDAAVALLEACVASAVPVLLDADALNHYAGRMASLQAPLGGRRAVLTPHPAELGRLLGESTEAILADRFAVASRAARASGATVLLKGTPTVVADRGDAPALIVARGTPALATGGAGDVLSGVIGALLPSTEPRTAAAVGAWIHGRAAELAGAGSVRGTALDDVVAALRDAWTEPADDLPYPVIAELPSVPVA